MKLYAKDVPNCHECPLAYWLEREYSWYCKLANKKITGEKGEDMPEWCPLPERKREMALEVDEAVGVEQKRVLEAVRNIFEEIFPIPVPEKVPRAKVENLYNKIQQSVMGGS